MDPASPTSSDNDEVMDDVDADPEVYDSDDSRDKDSDADDDDEDVDADADAENDPDVEGDIEVDAENENEADADGDDNDEENPPGSSAVHRSSSSPGPSRPLPTLRPGAAAASSYDIIPYVAAPHATSINAFCATPCMRWIFTGGNDGYIRKFDWFNSINGKTPLTVAQKHPFVDSVTRAGYCLSYWENEEPVIKNPHIHVPETTDDARLSPVYSLAVQNQALWMLSGLESGGINVQSVRHDEGKIITCLRKHTSAVSVLTLAYDERSFLSGSWDKAVYDWDLNTGQVVREYIGSAGQISTVLFRPVHDNTIPIPRQNTLPNGVSVGAKGTLNGLRRGAAGLNGGNGDPQDVGPAQAASPAESEQSMGSLFGDDGDDEFIPAMAANGIGNDYNQGGSPNRYEEHRNDASTVAANGTGVVELSTIQDGVNGGRGGGQEQPPTNGLDIEMSNTDALFGDDTLSNPIDSHIPGTTNGQGYPHSPPPHASQSDSDPGANHSVNNLVTSFLSHSNATEHDPSPPSPSSPSSPHAATSTTKAEMHPNTFLTSSIDGTLRIWDRRQSTPIAVAYPQKGVPPWCTGATWSVDGNYVYAGRRNCAVEEYSIYKGFSEPVRSLKFPQGSGPVSAIASMPNGRHLLCASYDNLRLYDLKDTQPSGKHSMVPFLIVPGHHGGVVSCLCVDPTCQFIISTGGNRGWEGANTEVLLGYEIVPMP